MPRWLRLAGRSSFAGGVADAVLRRALIVNHSGRGMWDKPAVVGALREAVSAAGSVVGRVQAYCEASFAAVRIELNRDCSNSDRIRSGAPRPVIDQLPTAEVELDGHSSAEEEVDLDAVGRPDRAGSSFVLFDTISVLSDTEPWRAPESVAQRVHVSLEGSDHLGVMKGHRDQLVSYAESLSEGCSHDLTVHESNLAARPPVRKVPVRDR